MGMWVGHQRAAKKRLDAGEPNRWITAERVAKLDALEFEWSPPNYGTFLAGRHANEAGWEAMRAKLVAFKAEHGHCRVPKIHTADLKLGRWVARQRVYKKKLDAGDSNPRMTVEREAKLEALGLEWVLGSGMWKRLWLSKRVIVNVDIVSDDIAEPGEVSSPAAIGPLQQLVPQPPEIL